MHQCVMYGISLTHTSDSPEHLFWLGLVLNLHAPTYSDGTKKYVLLSLDKKNYQNAIRKRLEGSNIEQILGSIKGHPKKENFLKLSKAIKIIAGSLDAIINETKLSKNY